MSSRVHVLSLIFGFVGFSVTLPVVANKEFPNRPIRMVIPFPAGGGADFMGREISKKLAENLGQPVIVENKAGASGIVGAQHVAQAKPDGYTLLLGTTGTHSTNYATTPGLSYHPLNSFETVSIFGDAPFLVCLNSKLPVKNFAELIQYARANPGKLEFGSSGMGSSAHLGFEAMNAHLKTSMLHVPYSGLPPAITDTLGGQISMTMAPIPSAKPHIQSGKLNCVATGGRKRSALFPNMPTISESGVPGLAIGSWYGIFAPKGTPSDIVSRISASVLKALNEDDLRGALERVGADALSLNPAQSKKLLEDDISISVKIATELNIKVKP